jgi:hypothetical protein
VSNWKWTRDAAWTILVGLAAALFSLWLYHRGGGVILEQGPYYGSDIFRVRENLVHPDSPDKSYFRLSVHPLYGYVCVLAQALRKVFALGDYAAFAVLAFIQGGMLAALLFVSARAWGATSRLALGIVAFMCSTAGFVFWSSVTETHVWGGISILLFILMASWVPRLRFACAFLAFALVFHSFFVRYQGFLFAPEYTAVACLVSGMALGRLLRERAPAVLLVAALLVAAVNVPGFITAAEDARAGRGSPRMGVQ